MLGKRIILKARKAKKPYYCDMCREIIKDGDVYTTANFFIESYQTMRFCSKHSWKDVHRHCKEAQNAHRAAQG